MLHTQSVGFEVMEQQLQQATQKPSLPVILTYLTTVKLQKPTDAKMHWEKKSSSKRTFLSNLLLLIFINSLFKLAAFLRDFILNIDAKCNIVK